jgi:hypothetical protein
MVGRAKQQLPPMLPAQASERRGRGTEDVGGLAA